MPQFFLDIQNTAGGAEDQDGIGCNSFEDAHGQAIRGIRSLLAAEVLEGRLDLNGTITIRDGKRRELAVVRFDEAVKVLPLAEMNSSQSRYRSPPPS